MKMRYLIRTFAIGLLAHSTLHAQIKIIGTATIPGTEMDRSGLSGQLENGTPIGQLGGWSAIENQGKGLFWVLPDRGPQDGAVSYPCRVHTIRLQVEPNADKPVSVELLKTTLLRSPEGKPLIGLAAEYKEGSERARFDPEGIRQLPNGSLAISDEYGPRVLIANDQGKGLKWLKAPPGFEISAPSAVADEEAANNKTGRQPNGGFEGIANCPNGDLLAFTQKPLLQDSSLNDAGKRIGKSCRIVRYGKDGVVKSQIVYRLESDSSAVSEILAIDDQRALVLERDSAPGAEAKIKQIFLIDLKPASDVSKVASLSGDLPENIKPVTKSLWLDLLDPQFGLAGPGFPAKPEGLAWGPELEDGSKTLVVCVDNDFVAENPSIVWVFSFKTAALTRK